MTPRTLNELIAAKQKDRDDKLKALDRMNAVLCNLVAVSGHLRIKNRDPKAEDFITIKSDVGPEDYDTPEQIALKMSMI